METLLYSRAIPSRKVWWRMEKANLILGRKYLHRRRTVIAGIPRQAERWLRCERITPTGAVFSRDFETEIELSVEQIEQELMECLEK